MSGILDTNEDDEVVRPCPASAWPDSLGRLVAAVARMPLPVFAVVDGGHFDDLPSDLSGAGLFARSLFLGHGKRDVERHGPWLVPMRHPADVGAVLGVVGELPAVVFWSCPAGDVALYGHLRRINMARLPVWAAAGQAEPEPGVEADRGYEAVLFRHWDPSVLGALLPVLDETQFSRILGPAAEVAFFAADYGGSKRVVSDPEWPVAPAGMLTIRPEQIEGLVERRQAASRRRVAGYLREVTGTELAGASEGDLHLHVLHSEASAREFGIATEAGQCRWAYLMYATRGQIAQQPDVAAFVRTGNKVPDEQVRDLMGATIAALERRHASPGLGRPL